MTLETESNTVETFKVAARNFAALADAVGEQVRPAIKFAVDTASVAGNSRSPGSVSPIAEAAAARESLDGATRDFSAFVDAVGDQVRPAIKFAVDTADAIESARARLWKSITAPTAVA